MAEAQDTRSQRLDEVLRLVRDKVAPEKRDLIERFVRRYFSQLDPEDLAERQPADLYGAALSHWNFARKRDPGSVRLRVTR
jgi:glutamate dehydrogenase